MVIHDSDWCVHKMFKKVDRCGEGKSGASSFMSLEELISIVHFSLTKDNVVMAAHNLWHQIAPISMGHLDNILGFYIVL